MSFHYFFLPYTYLQFTLSIIFTNCQCYEICNLKITSQCKILIVPEEGWFGKPKYSTPTKKSFYVVSASASAFFILYDDPTYTSGIIVTVVCLNVL